MAKKTTPASTGKPTNESGAKGLIIALVVSALISGGAGFGFATMFLSQLEAGKPDATAQENEKEDHGAKGDAKLEPASQSLTLPPIVTNIGDSKSFIRIECTIHVDRDYAETAALATAVAEDILALLKSISLKEIQGLSGLNYLRDQISDRLNIRSEGKARGLNITSLVIE